MNIHDFVSSLKDRFVIEITKYIENVFSEVIDDISTQHDINKDLIRASLKKTLNKSIKKCSTITKLGHGCKYNAKEGHELCIKHLNLI